MKNLQNKIYRLIEQLNEDELEKIWETIYSLSCDFHMKRAIEEVKDTQQPWDILTYDEALQYLQEQGYGDKKGGRGG